MIIAAAMAAALAGPAVLPPSRSSTPGLVDVSRFDDKAMVIAVKPAPCAARNRSKWPEAGCVRAAQHEPARK